MNETCQMCNVGVWGLVSSTTAVTSKGREDLLLDAFIFWGTLIHKAQRSAKVANALAPPTHLWRLHQ